MSRRTAALLELEPEADPIYRQGYRDGLMGLLERERLPAGCAYLRGHLLGLMVRRSARPRNKAERELWLELLARAG